MKVWGRRQDENQSDIVKTLRMAGREVVDMSFLGRGFPDLLVSNSTDMWLMEVKNPERRGQKPKKLTKLEMLLTKRQAKFHESWKGKKILIVETVQEALDKTR